MFFSGHINKIYTGIGHCSPCLPNPCFSFHLIHRNLLSIFLGTQHLKGQSHEINVWFFWAQWKGKILLIFLRKGFSSFYQHLHTVLNFKVKVSVLKPSTGQMNYRWETLTPKLSMKTLIKWTETLPREYLKDFVYPLSPKKPYINLVRLSLKSMHVSKTTAK